MKNFRRALATALRFRATVFFTFLCSGLVAVLWGSNIGALYPVIQVAFQGQSLQSWVQNDIDQSQARLTETQQQLDELRQEPGANARQIAS